jgi:hypothetical protein
VPRVELVYDGDCPNVAAARAQLVRAFAQAKLPPRWIEWRADDAGSPAHVRGLGSPTILVDGRDLAAAEKSGGTCCRLYVQADGALQGVPSVKTVAAALANGDSAAATARGAGGAWRLNLAILPGVAAALLPKIACPACWPAYAGPLASLGLGFLLETRYLLPLTALFLAVAAGALAYRARSRRGYGPFVVGLAAAAVIVTGKFAFDSDAAMYAGVAILVGASLWNTWPRSRGAACTDASQTHS